MIEVEVGGTIVEFPDGTPPDVMKAALQKRFGAPAQQQPAPQAPQAQAQASSLPNPYADYTQMRQESQNLIGEGIEQVQRPTTADQFLGAVKVGLGGLGYVTSPINAALRTVVGRPVENLTGVPKEYTEFAAGMALPVPKRIPTAARSEPKAALPTTQEHFAAARAGYEQLPGNDILRPAAAPKTFGVLEEAGIKAPQPISEIEGLIDARRSLKEVARGSDLTERAAAMKALPMLDKRIGDLDPQALATLKEADANWAVGKEARTAERAVERGAARAEASGVGGNVDNAIRQEFRALTSPARSAEKKIPALRPDAMAEAQKVHKGSKAREALRLASRMDPTAGGLTAMIHLMTALASGGRTAAVQAPLAIGGFAARKLSERLTQQQAAKVSEVIRSRSPLAKKIGNPMQDWGKAIQELETSPTPRNIARLAIASRNFSHNLKDAGIDVSPESLALPAASFDDRFTGLDAEAQGPAGN